MTCRDYRPVGKLMCECGAPVWEHRRDKRDAWAGMRRRETALSMVQAPADWIQQAERAVTAIAKSHQRFTTDLVWNVIETPREPRALGTVMRSMERSGIISPTADYQLSQRKERHRAPIRVWESHVYEASPEPPPTPKQSGLWS